MFKKGFCLAVSKVIWEEGSIDILVGHRHSSDRNHTKIKWDPLLCVRTPPRGRAENVHSGLAHAQLIDAGANFRAEAGLKSQLKTQLKTQRVQFTYCWRSSKGEHSAQSCATAVEAMAGRYLLYYSFWLIVLLCKMCNIWWHVHCWTLVTFLQLFGAQITRSPASHSVSLWIKRIKVKSHTQAIYFAFFMFYLFSVL